MGNKENINIDNEGVDLDNTIKLTTKDLSVAYR